MKKDFLHQPILITGIERSGSSIIAKIVSMCNVHVGDVNSMNENCGIKSLVNTYYSSKLFIPANGQKPLPNTKELYIPTNWNTSIEKLLVEEGYKSDKPWMYKSCRISQLWPIWKYTYPNAKWILVRRKTSDIIQSCLKTAFMNAYSDQEGWLDWVHQHEALFVEMIEAGATRVGTSSGVKIMQSLNNL